jgi:uncharacterized protein YrzB (UPF0473 family)
VGLCAVFPKNGQEKALQSGGGWGIVRGIRTYFTKEDPPMSDEFGPNFITVTDEDGTELVLEYVDALEHNGTTYMAFFPAEDESESAEDYGLVIMKQVEEDGEEFLSTLDSDEELNEVYDLFMEQILSDEDE